MRSSLGRSDTTSVLLARPCQAVALSRPDFRGTGRSASASILAMLHALPVTRSSRPTDAADEQAPSARTLVVAGRAAD